MEGLTEGRIVHYVIADGEHRPAIVVKVWSKESGVCNLVQFTDSKNDGECGLTAWRTSINPDEDEKRPGTWHWIEKA